MSETLHLAFDARMSPKPSGVGVYTDELLKGLAKLPSLRITAIASPDQKLPEGVERLATRVAFDAHGRAELFEHLILPRRLRERGVQVLHGPNTILPAFRAPFARVVTIHDVAFRRFPKTLTPAFKMLMEARTAIALRVADTVLAVSEFTAHELRCLYPGSAEKVSAVLSGTPEGTGWHGADPTRADALLASIGLSPRRYFCAVGTLEPRKNLVTLLEAFARAELGGMKLALVGDRGWKDGPLRHAISRTRADSVILTGWLDGQGVRDLIGRSAGLLYPSLYEGFGFPPLEALALGVPAACSDLPPIRESCADRVLRVPPLDPEAWVTAFGKLARAPTKEPWLGRSFDQVAQETAALYRSARARFQAACS
jgi:glycosyltransferase involved in cell wall biosynthesis